MNQEENKTSRMKRTAKVNSSLRKKLRAYLMYALFLAAVAAAAVLLCVFVFFKVHTVLVTGNTKYSDSDILETADIRKGDNVVMLETEIVEERILKKFPYMEDVNIKKKLPVTVEIAVDEAKAQYSVVYGEGMYAYTAASRKLLEAKEVPAEGSTVVRGGEVQDVNGTLVFADEKVMNAFDIIVAAIEELPDCNITEMNISNIYDISLIYDNRIKLEVGGISDIDYKLSFGWEIVTGGSIGSDEMGILDLTLTKDVDKAYFSPITNTSGFDSGDVHTSFEDYLQQKEKEEQEQIKADAEKEAAENAENGESRGEPVEERGDDIPDAPYTESSEESDDGSSKVYGTDAGRGDDIPDV